jgi:imidazolonepropionase-like amidohydrolase
MGMTPYEALKTATVNAAQAWASTPARFSRGSSQIS